MHSWRRNKIRAIEKSSLFRFISNLLVFFPSNFSSGFAHIWWSGVIFVYSNLLMLLPFSVLSISTLTNLWYSLVRRKNNLDIQQKFWKTTMRLGKCYSFKLNFVCVLLQIKWIMSLTVFIIFIFCTNKFIFISCFKLLFLLLLMLFSMIAYTEYWSGHLIKLMVTTKLERYISVQWIYWKDKPTQHQAHATV